MADPKNKLKLQKDLLIDENDLLKDQTSLFNNINKLIEKKNKNYVGIRSTMKGLIDDIQKERDLSERINKIVTVNKNINKEIKDLTLKQNDAHQKAVFWRRMGGRVAQLKFEAQERAYEREIKYLNEIKKTNNQIKKETQNVVDLQKTASDFSNISLLNSLKMYGATSKLQSILEKVVILTKDDLKLTNSILKVFQRFEAPLLIAIYLGMELWNVFKKLDEEAFKARKEMGMMRDIHQPLRQQAEELYRQYANLGLTVEHVYKTQKAIALELGSSHAATKAIVEQASLMSAQFGISEDITVKMLKTLGQMNQTTADSQTRMIGFAGAMANAAGVPLPQVMDDVAKASATTRTMFAKTPLDMIKAAVEARRLGTTLNQMSESSRKILNFTESMEAEMEASVLLGRPLNLQLARQLAYNGKIAESNKEILRLSKQMDFEHMDVYQAEAFARATGKTVDELRSMIQADRELNNIKLQANKLASEGNFSLKKQLEDYEKLQKANEAVAKSRGEDYEMMVKQRANQERLTSISNNWKKIVMELGYAFLPIIDVTLAVIANMMPLLSIGTKISGIFYGIGGIFVELSKLSDFVLGTKLTTQIGKVSVWFAKLGTNIAELGTKFKWIGKVFSLLNFAKPFVKAIPVIGWIITGITTIYDLFKNWDKIKSEFSKGFVDGLKAVWDVIFESIIGPFKDAWNWLKKTSGFMAESPSKLGLMIVGGIKAVGTMLFDSLISPFKLAWDFITKMWSGIGGVITEPLKKAWDTVQGWFGGNKIIQPSVEKPAFNAKISTFDVPVDRPLTDKEIRSYKELDKVPDREFVKQTLESTEQKTDSVSVAQIDILNELKAIRQDLLNGKIAVNLDGQLVSTIMNRNNSFRGTYGSMQR
jgi:hypothetical protein